jgi:hypothetical protein
MFNKILLYLFIILSIPFGVAAREYSEVFSGNNFNITSLMNAVYQNDHKSTGVFLKSGANVNETNLAGVTALHVGAKTNSVDAMKVLVEYKANLNAMDDENWTPLMRACLLGNREAAEFLIKSGANIWLRNKFGETALLHSVMSGKIGCLLVIKNNYKLSRYDTAFVVAEINKSLGLVYKKEDKEMESILDEFYNDVVKYNEELIKKEAKIKEEKDKAEREAREKLEKERLKREREAREIKEKEKAKREKENAKNKAKKEKERREKEEKDKKNNALKTVAKTDKNKNEKVVEGKAKKENVIKTDKEKNAAVEKERKDKLEKERLEKEKKALAEKEKREKLEKEKKEKLEKDRKALADKEKREKLEKEKMEKLEKEKREKARKEREKREKKERREREESIKLINRTIYMFQGKTKKYDEKDLK